MSSFMDDYEDEQYCGNCAFHRREGKDWICDNEESDCYGCATEYRDICECHREKGEVSRKNER